MDRDRKLVIATHGTLAQGFESAIKVIVGDTTHIETMNCYTYPDFNLEQQIQEIMKNHNFETSDLVICTDLMGGSVNTGFIQYLKKFPFHLVTNINLAFLVDLTLCSTAISEELLVNKVQESITSVKYVNSLMHEKQEELDVL